MSNAGSDGRPGLGTSVTALNKLLRHSFWNDDVDGFRRCLALGACQDLRVGGVPILHIAALNGGPQYIQALVGAGVTINDRDSAGRTALMYVAGFGQELRGRDMMRLLIASGSSVNELDLSGLTALDYAIQFKNRWAIDELVGRGATTNGALRELLSVMRPVSASLEH